MVSDQVAPLQGSGPVSDLPEAVYPNTGQAFFALVHPEDRALAGQRIEHAKRTGDYEAEFRILLPGGVVRWVAARGGCLYDAAGAAIALTGMDMDITARKQAEAKLAEQLGELHRWHNATLGREARILDLKREVNALLAQTGQPPRYASAEGAAHE